MVYIYKKTIGNKEYYYLRASERKGKRVITKDIAYLGSSISEVKLSLKNLQKYKDSIRKAYKSLNLYLESNYYLERIKKTKIKQDKFLGEKTAQIEASKLHYDVAFKKLDKKTKQEILGNFIIEFAFNTASIEGNTINLEEAQKLLQEKITPKDKTLREIYDLQNTEEVFFWIYDLDKEITHELIINIHDRLMKNVDERKGYRQSNVRVMRSNFEATPAPFVKTDMDLLLKWYNKNKNILHPLVLATGFHHKFEKIHPFMDGNGRTGRMLLNYILLRKEYPPFIIHKKTRNEYLRVMRTADDGDLWDFDLKDYSDLIKFNSDEFIETYWNIFL